jgi:hypothetical protein
LRDPATATGFDAERPMQENGHNTGGAGYLRRCFNTRASD